MANTSATGGYLKPTSAAVPEDDDLDNIFLDLVVGLTGLPENMVRPRWQPVDRKMPDAGTNWCAIGVTDEEPDANAYVAHDGAGNGGAGQDNLQRNEMVRVLATFYGPNAKGFAKILRDGLSIPQNFETLELSLLALITTGTIRAVPEQYNEQWIRRYDLPLMFRRLIARSYAVENILSSDVTLQADDYTTQIHVNP